MIVPPPPPPPVPPFPLYMYLWRGRRVIRQEFQEYINPVVLASYIIFDYRCISVREITFSTLLVILVHTTTSSRFLPVEGDWSDRDWALSCRPPRAHKWAGLPIPYVWMVNRTKVDQQVTGANAQTDDLSLNVD
jgi:hypothetical protein